MARTVLFYAALGLFLAFAFAMLGYAYLARTHREEVQGVVIAREATQPREVPVTYVTSFWRRDSGLEQPMREQPGGYLYTVRLADGDTVQVDADRSADAFRVPTAEVGDQVTVMLRWRSLGGWFRSELPPGIRAASSTVGATSAGSMSSVPDEPSLALGLSSIEAADDAASSGQAWYYRLDTDATGAGTLKVDGFQVMVHVAVLARATGGGIEVAYVRPLREDNTFGPFTPGEVLFMLRPVGNDAYEAPRGLLPSLIDSAKPLLWIPE